MFVILYPHRIIYMHRIVINSQVPYNDENNNRTGNSENLSDVRGSQNNEESHSDQWELKQTSRVLPSL